LNGLDSLLVPLAQQSFNYVFGGAVIGVLAGLVIRKLGRKSDSAEVDSAAKPSEKPTE